MRMIHTFGLSVRLALEGWVFESKSIQAYAVVNVPLQNAIDRNVKDSRE